MRIGELAARTGLTTKTLRFYESAGVLPAPQRRPSGYRAYDEGAVDRLAFVRAAQAAGLTLAEIRDVIAVRDGVGAPCHHVVALLDAHAADLDRRIAELVTLRADVERLRRRAGTLDPATCSPAAVCQVIPTDAVPKLNRSASVAVGAAPSRHPRAAAGGGCPTDSSAGRCRTARRPPHPIPPRGPAP